VVVAQSSVAEVSEEVLPNEVSAVLSSVLVAVEGNKAMTIVVDVEAEVEDASDTEMTSLSGTGMHLSRSSRTGL
jgi:hypothetical protein